MAADVDLIGPIYGHQNTYLVSIDGFRVPNLHVICNWPVGFEVKLGERMVWEFDGDRDLLDQVLRLTANAMALGAGFSCFGNNRKPLDPYGVKVMRIDATRTDEGTPPAAKDD